MGNFVVMERNDLDRAVRQAGDDFYQGAIALAPSVLNVINTESSRWGVDPRYVLYVFLTQPKSRALAAGRNKEAMETLHRLYVESPTKMPSREFSMPPPDKEVAVDEVLAAVGQWAGTDFTEDLAQVFIRVAKKYGQLIQQIYADEYGEKVSTSKARKFLVYQLGLRLRSHTHWFKDHSLLYKAMDLLFDMS